MSSTAHFMVMVNRRGQAVGSGIYSEATPTTMGGYRYSRPLIIVERAHYHDAAAAVRSRMRAELLLPTKLGQLLRSLQRNGLLPRTPQVPRAVVERAAR